MQFAGTLFSLIFLAVGLMVPFNVSDRTAYCVTCHKRFLCVQILLPVGEPLSHSVLYLFGIRVVKCFTNDSTRFQRERYFFSKCLGMNTRSAQLATAAIVTLLSVTRVVKTTAHCTGGDNF
jgi:hypothetical protein